MWDTCWVIKQQVYIAGMTSKRQSQINENKTNISFTVYTIHLVDLGNGRALGLR